MAGTTTLRKHPAFTHHYKPGLAGKFTTAHTTSENPGMFQAWHLTQVKLSLSLVATDRSGEPA